MERGCISHFQYGQEDIAELANASLKVRHIVEKTRQMLVQHADEQRLTALKGTSPDQSGRSGEGELMFQKWVKGPRGWKFIDYEKYGVQTGDRLESGRTGRLLQMFIWSHFENILMLHPFIGGEPFYDGEELEVIGKYFVPTYSSAIPFLQSGKAFKTIQAGIPLYQELIPAPVVIAGAKGEELAGNWVTGVNLNAAGYAGIMPYLKTNGRREFMEARMI